MTTNSANNGAVTVVRLLDMERPIPPVELPNGRVAAVIAANAAAYAIRRDFQSSQDERLLWEFATAVIPDLTPEEKDSLTPNMLWAIMNMATGQAQVVLDALGNAAVPKPSGEATAQ